MIDRIHITHVTIKRTALLLLCVLVWSLYGSVYAKENDRDKVALNISGDVMVFQDDNVYLGWSENKSIVVTNTDIDSLAELYVGFSNIIDNDLTHTVKIIVKRTSDDSYYVGGKSDEYTLQDTKASGPLFIGVLEGGKDEKYNIELKFEKNTDEEYDSAVTEIHTTFDIVGLKSMGATEAQIFTQQKRAVTKEAPIEPKVKSVTMVNIGEPINGRIAGATACRNWPLWSWFMMILVYAGIAYLVDRRARRVVESVKNTFWQALILLGALGLWYFFDTCYTYDWMPFVLSVIAVIFILVSFQKTVGQKVVVKTQKKLQKKTIEKTNARGPRIT